MEVENSYDIPDFHWPFLQCIQIHIHRHILVSIHEYIYIPRGGGAMNCGLLLWPAAAAVKIHEPQNCAIRFAMVLGVV
jgi:hypothetical protein